MVINPEIFENGSTALYLYPNGEVFISVGQAGVYISNDQANEIVELLSAYLEEYN